MPQRTDPDGHNLFRPLRTKRRGTYPGVRGFEIAHCPPLASERLDPRCSQGDARFSRASPEAVDASARSGRSACPIGTRGRCYVAESSGGLISITRSVLLVAEAGQPLSRLSEAGERSCSARLPEQPMRTGTRPRAPNCGATFIRICRTNSSPGIGRRQCLGVSTDCPCVTGRAI